MNRPTLKASLLVAALATASAPAFAELVERTTTYADGTTTTETYYVEPYVQPPARTYYYVEPSTAYYTPSLVEVYEAPPITVTAPPMTEDEAITSDVVDVISTNPRISGRIGVETRDRDVKLTGMVTTPGQAQAASRDAQSVSGVRNVTNELRTKVGGSY